MSQLTLADIINASIAYLHEPMVSTATLDKIINFSQLIPATSAIGFEKRLAQQNTEVDYFIRGGKRDGGDKIFAASDGSHSPYSKLLTFPLWQRVKKFSRLWLQKDLPLHQSVEHIWLEMDNQELDKDIPEPCFFFEVSRQANKNPEWITDIALPILYNQLIAPGTKQKIIQCLESLPKYASLFHVGAMLSRYDSPIRLCIKIEIADVPNYLKQIEWSGDLDFLEKTLTNFTKDLAETIILDLDVCDRVMQRVGLEIKPAFRAKGWNCVLERLVKHELCFASERDALLNWQHEPEELQDKELRRQLTLMPPKQLTLNNLPLVIRRLNHVKIDCYFNAQLKAKMYYGLIYLYDKNQLQEENKILAINV